MAASKLSSKWTSSPSRMEFAAPETLSSTSEVKCIKRQIIWYARIKSGSTHPEQVVLLFAHMDSWDVGQGAMDDGGGMAAVWQAMDFLKSLSKVDKFFVPKRFKNFIID